MIKIVWSIKGLSREDFESAAQMNIPIKAAVVQLSRCPGTLNEYKKLIEQKALNQQAFPLLPT
jgi:hypothetical protein